MGRGALYGLADRQSGYLALRSGAWEQHEIHFRSRVGASAGLVPRLSPCCVHEQPVRNGRSLRTARLSGSAGVALIARGSSKVAFLVVARRTFPALLRNPAS